MVNCMRRNYCESHSKDKVEFTKHLNVDIHQLAECETRSKQG